MKCNTDIKIYILKEYYLMSERVVLKHCINKENTEVYVYDYSEFSSKKTR